MIVMRVLTTGITLLLMFQHTLNAHGYWQQRVEYTMDIDFDVRKHQYSGVQSLKYFNNSPDTITRVFYHLYFNAFQPGSAMDIRTQNLPDADSRLVNRIARLKPGEQGFLKPETLKQDGTELTFTVHETILEAHLAAPLLPNTSTTLDMRFTGQVPLLVRRAGRDSREGIDYSMAQWYPKICAYDTDGWHPNPYILREFYGVWGDFDVKITIDARYIVAATGYLQEQNATTENGTSGEGNPGRQRKKTWHFIAPDVHDFVWAADPEYVHKHYERHDGVTMHFFYVPESANEDAWEQLPAIMDRVFEFVNETFGQYPYKSYAFIQGGDGGMEYPMATLITGNRPLTSLVGVSVHEVLHAWYHTLLATNESLYAWMDEGFTSYASTRVMHMLRQEGLIPGDTSQDPFRRTYGDYIHIALSGIEEPMNLHADHFSTNTAYGIAAYNKGIIFLRQLEYIIGAEVVDRTLRRYFEEWKFRHPRPADFLRIAEKESGMILDWYLEYWVNTTRKIDYSIGTVQPVRRGTEIVLYRDELMPMPIEVQVEDIEGNCTLYYIPLDLMRGAKAPDSECAWHLLEPWPWVNPNYTLTVPQSHSTLRSVVIDPSGRLADIRPEDNRWVFP